MIRVLLPLVEIGLLVYCLIDAVRSDSDRIRNLPKVVWVILIVLLPLVGSIAWLVAGRPARAPATRTSGSPEYERPPRGPDDDPEFLRQIRQVDDEHARTLRQWEEDLRKREQQLRESAGDDPDGTTDGGAQPGPQDDPPAGPPTQGTPR